jgi:hypothetical protein
MNDSGLIICNVRKNRGALQFSLFWFGVFLTVLFPGSVTRSGQLHTRMVIPHFTMTCITCFSRYLISTSSIPLFSPKAKCVISAFLPFSSNRCTKGIIAVRPTRFAGGHIYPSIARLSDSPGPSRFGCFSLPCVYCNALAGLPSF